MGLEVQAIDAPSAPESVLVEMHDFYVEMDREDLPNDPPMPAAQRIAIWRHVSEHRMVKRWILREEGRVVGASLFTMQPKDDPANAYVRVFIGKDQRLRGLSRELTTPIVETAEEAGVTSLITDVLDGSPWEAKLEFIGMKRSLADKKSRLLIEDVDWELMDRWISRAAERAIDYELISVDAPVPEENLQKWCDLMLVMNTAPLEDLDIEPFTMSPEKWRGIEEMDMKRGMPLAAEVAVHKPTGDWVGLSEINLLEHQPELAWQGDTGVDPAHRNKGLGRWLKASMLKRFYAAHPEVERIDTENAGSNEAMLNINTEMGYEPLYTNNAWQGDLADIRSGLRI